MAWIARMQEAYEATLEELKALGEDEVMRINIDVEASVTTALACLHQLKPLRRRMAPLPELHLERIDGLERYALTLAQAHGRCLTQERWQRTLPQALKKARVARRLLRSDLRALTSHGLLTPGRLMADRSGRGYRNTAFDLMSLCALFRSQWSVLEGKSPVTAQLLDENERLADGILRALSDEGVQARRQARRESAELRERAFTLFVRAYDEARRAVTYLLWREGGADSVLPSLYKTRRGGRRKPKPVPTGADEPTLHPLRFADQEN